MGTDIIPASTIRRATHADLPEIGRLAAMLVRTHHEFDAQRFFPATGSTPRQYAQYLSSQLDEPDAMLLVAEHGGRVIGYAYGALEGWDYMALRGPAGVLHDLVVDPGYRGRGVGRLLLGAALEHFTTRGAPRVVLFTAERNYSAQRLFAQFGFRRTMVEMTRESGDGDGGDGDGGDGGDGGKREDGGNGFTTEDRGNGDERGR